ncbi:unnamed protein product [Rodentolepis nana]|uniref:Uncharacterized protein n=1 Tax=Rodentolepis nana TaxID=102285 RepID=A0A0R3TEV7_RODNA|nr:unnamed protein product [Rodentolepis nana]
MRSPQSSGNQTLLQSKCAPLSAPNCSTSSGCSVLHPTARLLQENEGHNQKRIPDLKVQRTYRRDRPQCATKLKLEQRRNSGTLRHSRLEENSRPQGATNSKLEQGRNSGQWHSPK